MFPPGPNLEAISAEYEGLLSSTIGEHLRKLREYMEARYAGILEAGHRALERAGKDEVLRSIAREQGSGKVQKIARKRLMEIFMEESASEREVQLD